MRETIQRKLLQNLAGFVSDADSPLHTMPKFAADGTTTFVLPKEAKNVNIKQNSMYIPGAPHPWQHSLYVRGNME